MKKIINQSKYAGMALVLCIFASCYNGNTPLYPSAAGFHNADSPVPPMEGIAGLASDGKAVVAVTHGGTIAYSPDDGVNWQIIPPKNIHDTETETIILFNTIAWGEGYFLAGGEGGWAAYSQNGVDWYAGVIGPINPQRINGIAIGSLMGQTVFTAVSDDGRIAHAVGSPEGPWYMADLSPFGTSAVIGEDILAVTYGTVKGSGLFVAVGENGKFAFMNDLSGKWYGTRIGADRQSFRGIAFGNERFIAVGDNGIIKTSADPETYSWITVRDTDFKSRRLNGISFDPLIKQFIAFSADSAVGISRHGDVWTAASFRSRFPETVREISSISCSALRIVIGGTDGTLLYSN
jgi:hypothetical protein